MVMSSNEGQRLLDDQFARSDLLESDRGTSYSTFAPEQTPKQVEEDIINQKVEDDDPGYTWKTLIMIMSTWIGVFLSSLDMSVMATLTSPISESFSAFDLLTWFINSYTIASALIQPLSGKLSDVYGRRNCLLWANFAFLIGNLICGLATESWQFILGRAIGGLGGGCLHSISTFVASDVIPLRSRGFWQGVSNVAFAAGFSIGGTLGGVINDAVGWKWAFLFQPPAILVSMILVFWLVPNSTTNRDVSRSSLKQIDFAGSGVLTLAILALMFGAVSGGNTLPWSSPLVYVPLILSPFLLMAFVYVEFKVAKDPIIPVQFLKHRSVLGVCLTNFLCSTANTALIYYLPMIMETQGMSPANAGLRQIPNAIGAFAGSVSAGIFMNKTGKYYWLCLFSLVLLVGASLTTLLTLDHVSGWLSYVVLFFNGFGFGGMLVTTLLALVSAADHKYQAVLTSASYAFRTAGNTLGTTIAGTIFQNVFGQQLVALLSDKPDSAKLIPAIRRREIPLANLPKDWLSSIFQSYDVAFQAVFAFIFATYVLGNITVAIIRENPLHSKLNRK